MKRLCVLFLVFVMAFSSVSLGSEAQKQDDSMCVVELDLQGNPRYTYLGHITIGLSIDEDGYLTYTGSARTSGYDLRINVYLQCSGNGVLWDDLEGYMKTGYNYASVDGSRTVPEGDLFYRAKIVAEVRDSDRNVLETATAYSSEERY